MIDINLTEDNFVKKKNDFYKLKVKSFNKIVDLVTNNWTEIKISEIYEIDQKNNILDSNSQNFCIIDESDQKYLLKKITKLHDLSKLEEQFTIQYWASISLKTVPKILKNEDDKIVVLFENFVWILMEFIEGEFFTGNQNQIFRSAKLIAKLHERLNNLPKNIYPTQIHKKFFTEEEKQTFEILFNSKKKWKIIFDQTLNDNLEKFEHKLFTIWKKINNNKNILDFTNKVVHFDLHPLNLIFSEKKDVIIDFGSIRLAPLEMALGFSLIKLSKRVLLNKSIKNSSLTIDKIKNDWNEGLVSNLNYKVDFKEMLIFGQAEVFRRFLSMIKKSFENQQSIFNGPLTHLECLILSDQLDN